MEFSKALHLQKAHGWARFISMQDHYNLLAREEEREMLRCAPTKASGRWLEPAGAGSIDAAGGEANRAVAIRPVRRHALRRDRSSNRAILDALGAIGAQRGVSRAQIALAWLWRSPVVVAPDCRASKVSHIDEAIAALSITLSDEEAARLEAPYTPRRDFQGVFRSA